MLLYKGKGNPLWLENWRPIALAKTVYKLFSTVLTDTLSEYLKRHSILSWEQEGFQALKRAQRMTSALWMKLDLLQALQRPFIGVHTDFYGAYPSMEHSVLEVVLHWLGVPGDFVELVRAIYSHAATTIVTAAGETAAVDIRRGMLQGDPLSCLLFLCYVEPLLRWLKAEIPERPVVWEAVLAAAYMFVDDLQSLLLSTGHFQTFTRVMEEWSEWVKMVVRQEKGCAFLFHARDLRGLRVGSEGAVLAPGSRGCPAPGSGLPSPHQGGGVRGSRLRVQPRPSVSSDPPRAFQEIRS